VTGGGGKRYDLNMPEYNEPVKYKDFFSGKSSYPLKVESHIYEAYHHKTWA